MSGNFERTGQTNWGVDEPPVVQGLVIDHRMELGGQDTTGEDPKIWQLQAIDQSFADTREELKASIGRFQRDAIDQHTGRQDWFEEAAPLAVTEISKVIDFMEREVAQLKRQREQLVKYNETLGTGHQKVTAEEAGLLADFYEPLSSHTERLHLLLGEAKEDWRTRSDVCRDTERRLNYTEERVIQAEESLILAEDNYQEASQRLNQAEEDQEISKAKDKAGHNSWYNEGLAKARQGDTDALNDVLKWSNDTNWTRADELLDIDIPNPPELDEAKDKKQLAESDLLRAQGILNQWQSEYDRLSQEHTQQSILEAQSWRTIQQLSAQLKMIREQQRAGNAHAETLMRQSAAVSAASKLLLTAISAQLKEMRRHDIIDLPSRFTEPVLEDTARTGAALKARVKAMTSRVEAPSNKSEILPLPEKPVANNKPVVQPAFEAATSQEVVVPTEATVVSAEEINEEDAGAMLVPMPMIK